MSAPTPPQAYPQSGFTALAVLFGVVFMNLVGFGLVVPLLPYFAQSLNAEPWQITIMFAAYSLGQFVAEPFWGRLSDRIGRKPVLMITVLANTVGYLALAFAPDIWTAVAIRLFTGLGAGNISTVQGYVADVTPPERRAGRMGMIGAAFGLGFVVGPGLAALTTHAELGRLGFQIPLFLAAGLTFLAALGVLFFLKESVRKAAPGAPRVRFLASLGEAQRNAVVSRVLLVTLIYMAGFAGMESTFGLWAQDRFGWGTRELGVCFMIVGVVSATFQAAITGRAARLFGEARVLCFGMLLFGAGLVVQTLNHAPLMAGVIMGVGAMGMALAMPNISALISRSTPPDRQGAMLGLNMACGSMGRIFGPIVAGALYSSVGPDAPLWVGGALTVPAAVMAINAGRAFRRAQAAQA
jgi:MFS family permease